jgi:TatD DNase family protein
MIDTHCHLDVCEEPVDDLVEHARAAGVERVLAIGMNPGSCRHALQAAEAHEGVFVSIGRHPHETKEFGTPELEELAALAQHEKVRAIGETGLDYHREYAPRDDQTLAFELQMQLAQQLHLALIVHTRDATDDTLDMLERHASTGIPVVLHCFSMPDAVDRCIESGYYCSFAGNVTYPNAKSLQEAAKLVPDELLLVETDAPFLTPQQFRGRHNEPAYVRSTAEFLAELRGQTYEQLEQAVQANAAWIFRW